MEERDGCVIRSPRAQALVPTLLLNCCVILDKSLHLSDLCKRGQDPLGTTAVRFMGSDALGVPGVTDALSTGTFASSPPSLFTPPGCAVAAQRRLEDSC